jgi:hypothetical protein
VVDESSTHLFQIIIERILLHHLAVRKEILCKTHSQDANLQAVSIGMIILPGHSYHRLCSLLVGERQLNDVVDQLLCFLVVLIRVRTGQKILHDHFTLCLEDGHPFLQGHGLIDENRFHVVVNGFFVGLQIFFFGIEKHLLSAELIANPRRECGSAVPEEGKLSAPAFADTMENRKIQLNVKGDKVQIDWHKGFAGVRLGQRPAVF